MSAPDPDMVARLVDNHRAFLAFLTPRLPSPEAAEDVLQAAFVRAMEKGGKLRDAESAVAWFFRLLRNALVDYHRRQDARGRALDREAVEAALPPDDEIRGAVCACIDELVPNLEPAYAEILRRVDLGEQSIAQVADALAITHNNARVRLHRARRAIKRELERSCGTCTEHGCLDCSCGGSSGGHA